MVSDSTKSLLDGRTVWIPRMTYIGGKFIAAAFRAAGLDAYVTPESDARTLELGGLYTSGEECYPEKVTIGDFLRIVHSDDFDPDRTAFFMPTANGPCRFGQYTPYLRQVLDELGHTDVPIVSPTSENGYEGLDQASGAMRWMWRAVVVSDLFRKMLLKTRPYETVPGATDEALEAAIDLVEAVLENSDLREKDRLAALIAAAAKGRDLFRNVPARYVKGRPLIGVVGEIFCRLNTFSNYDAARRIEDQGGEVWLSDVAEWIWYTNWSQKERLKREGKTISLSMLGAIIKNKVQHKDEQQLVAAFADDFVGYEEPHNLYAEVLEPGWPYLPADGALGEMAMSVGRSCYLHSKGADGIIDISPFSCMNGIVSEAVYHTVSKDYDGIPIRNFYFDASSSNMERDLDIFMELAMSYQKRKTTRRRYPNCFEG